MEQQIFDDQTRRQNIGIKKDGQVNARQSDTEKPSAEKSTAESELVPAEKSTTESEPAPAENPSAESEPVSAESPSAESESPSADRPAATAYSTIYGSAEPPEAAEQRAASFRLLGLPSLVYGLCYTFCMFHNSRSITMPVWVLATIVYVYYVLRQERTQDGVRRGVFKKGSAYYICCMVLAGLSCFLTDNTWIVACSYALYFMLLCLFLLHNYYEIDKWGFGRSLLAIFESVFGALGCLPGMFVDGHAYVQTKDRGEHRTAHAVAIGVLCALPVLALVGACLSRADAVFAHVIEDGVEELQAFFHISWDLVQLVFELIFGVSSAYCGMRFLAKRSLHTEKTERKKWDPVIAITFTALLAVVYVLFCGIQVVYLFTGWGSLPEHLSYADYARSGFFELLFVCIVNFVLVLFVKGHYRLSRILDLLLLLICGCTYIIIASSCMRMLMYIRAYQLTLLRVSVLVSLAVLACWMAGVVITILKKEFMLFRYCFAVGCVIYLLFAFSHVDYFIADYNLSRSGAQQEQNTDWYYLSTLSADAAPAIQAYMGPEVEKEKLEYYMELLKKGHEDAIPQKHRWYAEYVLNMREEIGTLHLRSFNVSQYLAKKELGIYNS